jgi:hypothetical protein
MLYLSLSNKFRKAILSHPALLTNLSPAYPAWPWPIAFAGATLPRAFALVTTLT